MNNSKKYDYEGRLVKFAANCVRFFDLKKESIQIEYYKHQLIRCSGSAALNYGEAQGAITNKDFIHKVSLVCKELKESRTIFRIFEELDFHGNGSYVQMLEEVEELIAIASKMIINKKKMTV
ncbi:MAG: four helix bundle protein [Bacteroidota bacterium]